MVETYILLFIFGIVVGSFLNVCIWRIPLNQSIVKPRSHCPRCNRLIAWYDNIPLLSYLILRGKCRHCQAPISFRYFLVELITGLLFILVAWIFNGVNSVSITYMIIVSCLIAITFIDLDHFIIPDILTYPCMFLGLVISLLISFMHQPLFLINNTMDIIVGPFTVNSGKLFPFYNALFGLIVGGGILYIIGAVAKLILKKDAMGGGDVKLLAALGTFLGYKLVLLTLILASFIGSIIGAIILIRARSQDGETKAFGHYIPFGPYLAIGAVIALLFGNNIIDWYFIHLLGLGGLPPGVK